VARRKPHNGAQHGIALAYRDGAHGKLDTKATGCTYTVSTGILLFQVDPSLVDTKNNTFRNNDVNLYDGSNA
jgi:hypothetical protein